MTELRVGHIRSDELPFLLEAHSWPDQALVLAFAADRYWFEPWKNQAQDLVRTKQGRVFSPQGELKWRLMDQGFQLIYLGENGPSQWLEDASEQLIGLQPAWRDIFLWGQRTDLEREWIEQQVPHRFDHPVSSQDHVRGRVKIRLEEWQTQAGLPNFVRYHSLQEVKGE